MAKHRGVDCKVIADVDQVLLERATGPKEAAARLRL